MIRMLALDLDETTLRSDGTISLYTMQTLQRAAAQGVILVAASGRPLRSLPEHLQACGVRYAVVSNGAAVYELEGEQLLRQLFLPADAVTALFQLVQEEQDRQVLVEAGLHGQMYAPADYVADPTQLLPPMSGARENRWRTWHGFCRCMCRKSTAWISSVQTAHERHRWHKRYPMPDCRFT